MKFRTQKWQCLQSAEQSPKEPNVVDQLRGQKDEEYDAIKPRHLA